MHFSHILCLSGCALAVPLLERRLDLDGNGIPDYCQLRDDGSYDCMENGRMERVIVVTIPATTTTPAAATGTAIRDQAVPAEDDTVASAARLPAPDQFEKDKGAKWNIEYVGDIQFTGEMASRDINGDKCRSSKLGGRVIWNCGDIMCGTDVSNCGFAMGPSFYGTDTVMTINTDKITNMNDEEFVTPWIGDSPPQPPQSNWGMDTSNVAAINDTHGVTYAWEIWRGAEDKSYSDRGNAVASVTLGEDRPMANRIGGLLTGPEYVQMGLLAILRDEDYIYIYSVGGPSNLIVSRVTASDDVFYPDKYESLRHDSNTWSSGIPKATDTTFGMQTADPSGKFGCAVYGSVFYNNYLKKYTIVCSIFQSFVNMYTSNTPYGPWSAEYGLLSGWNGYGSMVHPDYSPGGSHKEFYFSLGPNTKFNMFRVTFEY